MMLISDKVGNGQKLRVRRRCEGSYCAEPVARHSGEGELELPTKNK